MTLAYYNEFDPKAAAWLRELIKQGHIAPGDVDEQSIEDVKPGDLAGYRQCHFFAGIGGWSLALRLAGWPDDQPVWTGSCPCQPFSAAGKGAGFDDQRHLWPAWFHLIRERRPAAIFGEQVASKAADTWIDLVHADMEGVGYAFGCVPFPSAGVGAPHIRDRNYWVANAASARLESDGSADQHGGYSGASLRLANANGGTCGQGSSIDPRGYPGSDAKSRPGSCGDGVPYGGHASPLHGFWSDADWLLCRDGKWRPVEPGTQPLAHGLPARVVRLRGYGNAINPWQAAEFIRAWIGTQQEQIEALEEVA